MPTQNDSLGKWALLLLVFLISGLFVAMIGQFLKAIFLAGVFSALAHPLYRRFVNWFGGRKTAASIVTILLIVALVLVPLAMLLGIISTQAIKVGEIARPWVQQQLSEPDAFTSLLKSIPFYDRIEPYQTLIWTKAGELVSKLSGYLLNQLSVLTLGTASMVFSVFIMLYCMYFFLIDGDRLLQRALYYLPLKDGDERRMLERFTSVTRATLKGTAVIGILQGTLAGAAFAVAGIPSSVFWGAIMAVLSVVPSIGSALIWVPAAIILGVTGHVVKAIALAAFCGVVVGSLDNLLRPVLVGKDTQMHELLIFFGTLGGIVMFGFSGIIVGPIVAALFVTVWDIYGIAFRDVLPSAAAFFSDGTSIDYRRTDADGEQHSDSAPPSDDRH